nr:type II toxin-antitoxin system RelE/ParE family toxin [uncultured Dyadobacter sp.]
MRVGYELEWTERAVNDYEHLAEYLFEEWGEGIALRVLDELSYQIRRIRDTPLQFPVVDLENHIRRCVASPQTSIFFVMRADKIALLSIFDNRLDPKKRPGVH